MAARNLTVRLDEEVVRKARILAARRGTSISRIVSEKIEEAVGEEIAYESARRRAFELMDRGFSMGGRRTWTRDGLHERE